jgi:hypothetical protein
MGGAGPYSRFERRSKKKKAETAGWGTHFVPRAFGGTEAGVNEIQKVKELPSVVARFFVIHSPVGATGVEFLEIGPGRAPVVEFWRGEAYALLNERMCISRIRSSMKSIWA